MSNCENCENCGSKTIEIQELYYHYKTPALSNIFTCCLLVDNNKNTARVKSFGRAISALKNGTSQPIKLRRNWDKRFVRRKITNDQLNELKDQSSKNHKFLVGKKGKDEQLYLTIFAEYPLSVVKEFYEYKSEYIPKVIPLEKEIFGNRINLNSNVQN